MRFLRRVHSVTLRDKVLSCEVLKTLNVEPLLQVESYVWLSATMIWLFDQNVPGEIGARHVLLATPKGTRPIGRPRTRVAWLHLRPCLVQTWDNRNRQSYSTTTDHPLCNCNRLNWQKMKCNQWILSRLNLEIFTLRHCATNCGVGGRVPPLSSVFMLTSQGRPFASSCASSGKHSAWCLNIAPQTSLLAIRSNAVSSPEVPNHSLAMNPFSIPTDEHVPLHHFDRWTCTPTISYDKIFCHDYSRIYLTISNIMIFENNIRWYIYKYLEMNNM